jgi:hypothetical protein
MARKKGYVPIQNSGKSTWAKTFKAGIGTDGPVCGASAPEVAAMQTASQGIVDEINNLKAARAAYQSAVANSNGNLKKHIKLIRAGVKRMKSHTGYTQAIGKHLGVIGDEISIDLKTVKPTLKISRVPKGYKVGFNLHDYFRGVNIYRKRPSEETFRLKSTSLRSSYIDTEPQVEGTQYYAFFILNDKEVGQQSGIVTIEL